MLLCMVDFQKRGVHFAKSYQCEQLPRAQSAGIGQRVLANLASLCIGAQA